MFDKHKTSRTSPAQPTEPELTRPSAPTTSTPPASSAKVAMIGQGISIAGDVKSDTNLKIEGRIEGRVIQSNQDIEIGESGSVKAAIMAKVVKIAGEVIGDVGGTEKVMISRSGQVQGNIVAPRVQLEDGALFRGSIDMNPAQPAAAETKTKAAPKPVAAKSSDSEAGRQEPNLTLKSG